jgi:hypothetical protein
VGRDPLALSLDRERCEERIWDGVAVSVSSVRVDEDVDVEQDQSPRSIRVEQRCGVVQIETRLNPAGAERR